MIRFQLGVMFRMERKMQEQLTLKKDTVRTWQMELKKLGGNSRSLRKI